MNVLANRIAAVIREIKPEVVMTFNERIGGHPDHCAIGKAATLAFERSGLTSFETPGLAPFSSNRLYDVSYGNSMKKRPERYGFSSAQITAIDISGSLQEKMRAFRCHRSQSEMNAWLWEPDRKALASFGRIEYFIQGHQPHTAGERDLFE